MCLPRPSLRLEARRERKRELEEEPEGKSIARALFSSQNVLGVIPKKKSMGPPSELGLTPPNIVEDDISFEAIGDEQWNEYKLNDGRMLYIRSAIVKVSRTDRYDPHGCPIYLVNTQPLLKLK